MQKRYWVQLNMGTGPEYLRRFGPLSHSESHLGE